MLKLFYIISFVICAKDYELVVLVFSASCFPSLLRCPRFFRLFVFLFFVVLVFSNTSLLSSFFPPLLSLSALMPIDHLAAYDNINRSNLHLIDLNLSLEEQMPKFSTNRWSCPDWLPPNWKIDLKIRTSGKSAGNVDKVIYVLLPVCKI